MSSFLNDVKALGKDLQFATISPEKIQHPERLAKVCAATKITAVVTGVALLALAILLGPISLIFTVPVALGLYDVFRMAGNIQKIADAKAKGKPLPNPTTVGEAARNIGRGTIFAQPILHLALKLPKTTPA